MCPENEMSGSERIFSPLIVIVVVVVVCEMLNKAALTDDREEHGLADGRRRAHLALVDPAVPTLGISHLKRPVLRHRVVYAGEPLVRRVSRSAHRQQVQIPVPYPRHLKFTSSSLKAPIKYKAETCANMGLIPIDFVIGKIQKYPLKRGQTLRGH